MGQFKGEKRSNKKVRKGTILRREKKQYKGKKGDNFKERK